MVDYKLASYFPIFDRIAENDTVPPGGLLELLARFMIFLVKKHGPDSGLKFWSEGSKVLSICQTMLMHHHSSRLFLGLSRLLAFTCLYFPDLEVRDDARLKNTQWCLGSNLGSLCFCYGFSVTVRDSTKGGTMAGFFSLGGGKGTSSNQEQQYQQSSISSSNNNNPAHKINPENFLYRNENIFDEKL